MSLRIYAAYIDLETCAMNQTRMDKLTLILNPNDEFVLNDENLYSRILFSTGSSILDIGRKNSH